MMRTRILFAAATIVMMGEAFAHGGHGGAHAYGGLMSFGRPGDPDAVSRVYAVTMKKTRCLIPGDITAQQGDTLAFAAQYSGVQTSELVLGHFGAVANHARLATRDPELDHETHAMVHVEPETRETLVWRFTRVGIFEYGCFIPGPDEHASRARVTVFR